MATPYSLRAWEIPWTEEHGGLHESMESQKELDVTEVAKQNQHPQGILPTQGSNQGLLHCKQIITWPLGISTGGRSIKTGKQKRVT